MHCQLPRRLLGIRGLGLRELLRALVCINPGSHQALPGAHQSPLTSPGYLQYDTLNTGSVARLRAKKAKEMNKNNPACLRDFRFSFFPHYSVSIGIWDFYFLFKNKEHPKLQFFIYDWLYCNPVFKHVLENKCWFTLLEGRVCLITPRCPRGIISFCH